MEPGWRAVVAHPVVAHPVVAGVARVLATRPGGRATVAPDDPVPRRAAVAVVIRVPGAEAGRAGHGATASATVRVPAGGPELLLVRRAEYPGDPWSGHVALPGGRAEPDDPSAWATAVRETWEETGIDLVAAGRLLGELDEIHPRTPTLPPIVVRPHVAAVAHDGPLALSAELAAAFWVPLAHFAAPGVRAVRMVRVRGVPLEVPSYAVGADVVWGMTERILGQFLELVAAAEAEREG